MTRDEWDQVEARLLDLFHRENSVIRWLSEEDYKRRLEEKREQRATA